MKYIIDATNKKIGRIASEAASVLLGKKSATFAKNKVADVSVEIKNASKVSVIDKKAKDTKFERYSGYPGGLYYSTMKEIITKKGAGEVIKNAIYGMLPGNKLRNERMKRLSISE